MTLISGSLRGVVAAIDISRATMRNVYQNLFGAFVYNVARPAGRRGAPLSVHRHLLSPDPAAARDGVQLGDRHLERQPPEAVASRGGSAMTTTDIAGRSWAGWPLIAAIAWFFWGRAPGRLPAAATSERLPGGDDPGQGRLHARRDRRPAR
ncbi:MAG: hypothetical protein KatS3mg060_2281 [Dehalococcoidia bacterium]|nr:MAG: hypothetical protein KatS3mg060_2281 [Dehalococcoidia bacterium]